MAKQPGPYTDYWSAVRAGGYRIVRRLNGSIVSDTSTTATLPVSRQKSGFITSPWPVYPKPVTSYGLTIYNRVSDIRPVYLEEWDARSPNETYTSTGYVPVSATKYIQGTPRWRNQVYARALSSLVKRSKGVTFDYPVFVGELRESLEFGKDAIESLSSVTTKYLDKALKWKRRDPRELGKVAADAWLAYKFAVKPTVADVKSAAEALAQYHLNNYRRRLHYSSGVVFEQSIEAESFAYGPRVACGTETRETTYTESIVAHTNLTEAVASSYTVPETLGMTDWTDIFLTAYQLVPYSWLVDYFLDLSNYMEVAFYPRTNWSDPCYTFRREEQMVRTTDPKVVGPGPYDRRNVYARESSVTRSFVQTRVVGFDTPRLSLQLPTLGQGTNVAALVASRLLRNPSLNQLAKGLSPSWAPRRY